MTSSIKPPAPAVNQRSDSGCHDDFGQRLSQARDAAALEAVLPNVLATQADAALWWSKPHPSLEDRSPKDVATTPDGAEKVRDLLIALRYGGVV